MTLKEKLNAEFDLFRSIKLQQPKCSIFSSSFEIELRKKVYQYLMIREAKIDPECKDVMLCIPNLLDEACSYLCDTARLKTLPDERFSDEMEAWIRTFDE